MRSKRPSCCSSRGKSGSNGTNEITTGESRRERFEELRVVVVVGVETVVSLIDAAEEHEDWKYRTMCFRSVSFEFPRVMIVEDCCAPQPSRSWRAALVKVKVAVE